MSKIKIVFMMPSLSGGGTERFISILCSNINFNDFDVTLALVNIEGDYLSDIPSNVKIVKVGNSRVRNSIPKIIRYVNNERPDILFTSLGQFNLIMSLISPLLNSHTKLVIRESISVSTANKFKKLGFLYNLAYRFICSKIDNVVCQCEYMANDLVDSYNFKRSNIKVINNPVDFRLIDSKISKCKENTNNTYPINNECLKIIAAGRLDHQKGFDILIKALSNVERDFKLFIMGEGKDKAVLEGLVKDYKLTEKVKMLGHVSNPFPYFVDSDVYVLSSRYEGFPNVALEACAIGLPLIAFDSPGGIKDIISVDNGMLLDFSDSDEGYNINTLSRGIDEFLISNYMPSKIKSEVHDKFQVEKIIKQYEDYFKSI